MLSLQEAFSSGLESGLWLCKRELDDAVVEVAKTLAMSHADCPDSAFTILARPSPDR
ncbi:hypothetical protein P3L51_32990 [Streptomyces sp. PSRA5]|uniref:hypothetical protein n=1 Tax=Streptomyces panacea TaxID=3035064 RepID=UPI00339C3FEA